MSNGIAIDNTNLTKYERNQYINEAKNAGFEVIGYYFKSSINEAIERNELREGKEKVPLVAIHGSHAKLELPSLSEGYDKLFYSTSTLH